MLGKYVSPKPQVSHNWTFLYVAILHLFSLKFCISLSSHHCANAMFKFRCKKHLIRVRKTWFGLKYLFWSPWPRMSPGLLKYMQRCDLNTSQLFVRLDIPRLVKMSPMDVLASVAIAILLFGTRGDHIWTRYPHWNENHRDTPWWKPRASGFTHTLKYIPIFVIYFTYTVLQKSLS